MSILFRVLGPLTVGSGDEVRRIGAPKVRCLLAALLLEANQIVSLERLAEELWGSHRPPSATANLRSYALQLRREFSAAGIDPGRLVTAPGGYSVGVEAGELDMDTFQTLVAEARDALDRCDFAAADQAFAAALATWRGRALEDVPASPVLMARAASIDEQRLATVEDHVEARLATGDDNALVVRDLRAHIADNPTRERSYGQLMRALYRSGDVAGALAGYGQARDALVAELGVEPGPELRRLQGAILRRDPAIDGTSQATMPVPRQLPADLITFVGRGDELAKLATATPAVQVIHGPGGVGKSALAIRAAHILRPRYPDGQLYLDLQGSNPRLMPLEPADVLSRFLRSLGVPEGQVPANEAEAAARYRSILADRRVLVLLDNAVDVAQIRPLIPGVPGCGVMITSRRTLTTLDGAEHLALEVLSSREAVALLAGASGSARVAAEPETADRLAVLCDRLPLALRICAARLAARPDWTVADLVDRLTDERGRLDELHTDDLAVRSCFQASYRALRAEAARAFRLAGLLRVPDLSPAAMAAMLGAPLSVAATALDRLTEARLVEAAGVRRYRVHDLLRLYAAELAGTDELRSDREAAVHRAAIYYLGTARRAVELVYKVSRPMDAALAGSEGVSLVPLDTTAEAVRWLGEEFDNVLAVADQAARTTGSANRYPAQLLRTTAHYLMKRGQWNEIERLATLALRTRKSDDLESEAIAEALLSDMEARAGRFDSAKSRSDRALAIWRQLGNLDGEATVLNNAGMFARRSGHPQKALSHFEACVQVLRRMGDGRLESLVLQNIAETLAQIGRHREAIERLEECLVLDRRDGAQLREGDTLAILGREYAQLGRFDDAVRALSHAIQLCIDTGNRMGELHALLCRSEVKLRLHQPGDAIADAHAAITAGALVADTYTEAATKRQVGKALMAAGRTVEAGPHLDQARSLFEVSGLSYVVALEDFLISDHEQLPRPVKAPGQKETAR